MSIVNKDKTALFIGHSKCYNLKPDKVYRGIYSLIEKGIDTFLNGGQGEFDRMCAYRLADVKKEYAFVRSFIVIPYPDFNIAGKELFDRVIYPEGMEKYHYKAAIPAQNKYMVENSRRGLCYVNRSWGGAAATYKLAEKKGLYLINTADE